MTVLILWFLFIYHVDVMFKASRKAEMLPIPNLQGSRRHVPHNSWKEVIS